MSCVRYTIAAALAFGAASCGGGDEQAKPGGGAEPPRQARTAATANRSAAPWRDLLTENGRAELDVDGPFIDFGTIDQHKYTLGGWNTGWGDTDRDAAGVSVGKVDERKVRLVVPSAAPAEVVLRARSAASRQQVTVRIDGKSVGKAKLGSEWSVVKLPVSGASAGEARRIVELSFSANKTPVAEIDWLWLRTGERSEPPKASARVEPVRVGDKVRRSLVADTPRRYTFYLHVPQGGSLGFDYGADAEVAFRVVVHTADGESRELFSETAKPGAWRTGRVDLAELSGEAIRLDLITSGPAGRAGWGLPSIYSTQTERKRKTVASRPKNAILVVYDTTRADTFAAFDPNTRVKAPHFDALAGRSTVLTRAYSNEAWTRPSTATIVTGLYPDTHRAVYARDVLPDEIDLLSEHLKRNGFETAAILGNSVLGEKFGFDQGWDHYANYGRTDDSADNIFGKTIEWLDEHHDKPFFIWIQSHDSHTPYEVDRKYTEEYFPDDYKGFIGDSFTKGNQVAIDKGKVKASETDVAWAKALYDGEATYQDEGFGRLIARLDELGVADDTLIVVTNDHGEEFGEHDGWGHGWTQYDEMLRAPLLFHYPPIFDEAGVFDEVVEQVDVAPTIVDALGLPPMPQADGVSLLPALTGGAPTRPQFAIAGLRDRYRTVMVGRWKLIVDTRGRWSQLYDVVADPGESKDRSGDAPIAGRLCEVYLGEALGAPRKSARQTNIASRKRYKRQRAQLDRVTRRELESLGYLGSGEPDE